MSYTLDANPLDSTFHILKGLHDEIQELRDMVAQERHARTVDVNNLSHQIEAIRASKNEGFGKVARQVEELQKTRDQHHAATEAALTHIEQNCDARFAKLEAAVEANARAWKDEASELRRRILTESQQLIERCKALEKKTKEERRLSEIAMCNARERHDALRAAVEKIEAVICDNHMTKDPFRHFGERPERPSSGFTVGGLGKASTSRSPAFASTLASTHCGSRPLTASTAPVTTPTSKKYTISGGLSPENTALLPDVVPGGA